MRTPKISPNIPEKIVINGRTLIRKSAYQGKILKKTPELEAEINKIDKEISRLELETYNMQKINSMFMTNRQKKYRMQNAVNYIGTDIEILREQKKKLMKDHLAAQ